MSLLASGSWKVETKGFSNKDARTICSNKLIVFIGDSLVRGMYKDLIHVLKNNSGLLSERVLKQKGEKTVEGDTLIEGGILDGLFNGKSYIEVREYCTDSVCVRFYFVTRCYYDYIETILQDFMQQPVPDVVFMSSCLWDVTRWPDEIKSGENALCKYKANLEILFTRFKEVLPEQCLIVWGCCMPMGEHVRGGFMDAALKYQEKTLRLDILEANYFASLLASKHEIDVVDYHWFFRHFQASRKADGIHWNSSTHRNMTYMLLYHLTEAWHITDIVPKEIHAAKMTTEDSGLGHYMWPRYEQTRVRNAPPNNNDDSERSYWRAVYRHRNKLDHKHRYRYDRRDAPYRKAPREADDRDGYHDRGGYHVDRRLRMNQERVKECETFDRMLGEFSQYNGTSEHCPQPHYSQDQFMTQQQSYQQAPNLMQLAAMKPLIFPSAGLHAAYSLHYNPYGF